MTVDQIKTITEIIPINISADILAPSVICGYYKFVRQRQNRCPVVCKQVRMAKNYEKISPNATLKTPLFA